MSKKIIFIAFVVSLGGFLFGFDAGIISGVMSYAGPEFNLSDGQTGWVVSSPSFAAMIAMLISGRLSDIIGRKKILIVVAFSYALSALLSAYAISYEMLYIARMIGGFAFGAALILAPTYIAEISSAKNRGKLVSIQQLNIVLGFFAAFLSNYYFNKLNTTGDSIFTDENVWRWMLGVELIPAVLYFIFLFFVPKSPRWLYMSGKLEEAKKILRNIYGAKQAEIEISTIGDNIKRSKKSSNISIKELLKPSLRFILIVGLVIGVLQQITGINAVYFYATSIFKQTGIGTDAAFSSGVLLSFTSVIFTIVAILLIDRMGRRPLLLIGMAGISISLLMIAFGFNQATYKLTPQEIVAFENFDGNKLKAFENKLYESDLEFKRDMKSALGNQVYAKNEGAILEAATDMNPVLVLVGILGFIACFAFSLGPVMWVLLSELYPNKYRGLAIGVIGFINSFVSWLIQQIFPWELSTLGNALTFLIFGIIAVVGFLILLKILPETKGKSLEQIEFDLVKN
ncbi:MAG: sugar porter family MFS transporter [Lutibacter sp.]|uniref:sugar porter family MFS transporter n=1 Tax=Lutibacter sp. TaxID=1925666 RepID=UPI0018338AB3|nr:sugar porter family MFS transporter [Lutibacter sp.]MBT8316000.1 sugar porter family MFS transporter [Lutibacter sp.]NNJ56860.1 sugar porter family MFS transporter [Lutibacter sp.]